jgi:hypothetical protein
VQSHGSPTCMALLLQRRLLLGQPSQFHAAGGHGACHRGGEARLQLDLTWCF